MGVITSDELPVVLVGVPNNPAYIDVQIDIKNIGTAETNHCRHSRVFVQIEFFFISSTSDFKVAMSDFKVELSDFKVAMSDFNSVMTCSKVYNVGSPTPCT